MAAKEENKWFRKSLELLGYPDPKVVDVALISINNDASEGAAADKAFQSLTLWLEDRVIREWSIAKREPLRGDNKNFWMGLPEYLDALECPQDYFGRGDGNNNNDKVWYRNASKRRRTLYWMVSCAIWEARGDSAHQKTQQGRPPTSSAPSSSSSSSTTNDGTTNDTTTNLKVLLDDPTSFPLGFTTNDPKVDAILKRKRMEHLLQLRHEQDHINACIVRLQQTTVQESKPMKKSTAGRRR